MLAPTATSGGTVASAISVTSRFVNAHNATSGMTSSHQNGVRLNACPSQCLLSAKNAAGELIHRPVWENQTSMSPCKVTDSGPGAMYAKYATPANATTPTHASHRCQRRHGG